jgi:hypothetical protein
MYNGKYEPIHFQRKNKKISKTVTLLLSLLLLFTAAVGGTFAYLTTSSGPVENKFTPSIVDCEVEEKFDGTTKSNVNVINTGDTDAYIRVNLVTYRVNDEGQHIGGTAEIPYFSPGTNWIEYEGYYYYTLPVQPGERPDTTLINNIDNIELLGSYNDADGGKQVIEVMAEAIQSAPAEAVGNSWGVSISEDSVEPYTSQGGAGK